MNEHAKLHCLLIVLLFAPLASMTNAQDIVIYGATPGGIATAVTAARLGHSVTLVEYHPRIGGMKIGRAHV